MKKRHRTPWQKIRDAAEKGTGVRLTQDECRRLAQDNAIMTRAELDDEESAWGVATEMGCR